MAKRAGSNSTATATKPNAPAKANMLAVGIVAVMLLVGLYFLFTQGSHQQAGQLGTIANPYSASQGYVGGGYYSLNGQSAYISDQSQFDAIFNASITSSPGTSMQTTISAQSLPTFNLTGWTVIVNASGYAAISFNYTTSAPVYVYLYNNATLLADGPGGEFPDQYAYLNATSGTGQVGLTWTYDTTPASGNHFMVAYYWPYDLTPSWSSTLNKTPIEIWNKTFTFSGPKMVITNASLGFQVVGASGVYWYSPTDLTVYITNKGDLPSYGYYLREWVDNTPLHIGSGTPEGWVRIGGPQVFSSNGSIEGIFQPPPYGNYSSGSYHRLHVEWVYTGSPEETLAAQYNGQTQIP